jgi:hypothetical protein
MTDNCGICGLEIADIDRHSGRVGKFRGVEVHSWCQVIRVGVVPECPLADCITPKPCTNQCVQAKACPTSPDCGCCCDNMLCQIGQSVRELRSKGEIGWKGYVPIEAR